MKKIYILLFSFVFVSSFGMAETAKSSVKHEGNKKIGTLKKSAKISSSKLVDHKIGSGDTLYSIAKKHHTTVGRIELVNGLKKGDSLKIGKLLRVPENTKSSEKKSSDISLASVMQKIEKEKKKVQPEIIKKTKTIASAKKVSNKKSSIKKDVSKKKPDTKTLTHTVKKGDTLYTIAKNNHTTVSALEKMNHIRSGKNLKLGQVIALSKVSHTPKPKIKVAKLDTKVKKKTISSKKPSRRKLVLEPKKTKKSFLASLRPKSKSSSLKLASAKKQLGKRYVYGATGPRTFDCSGFTSYVCKKNGVCVPRTSINQSKVGKRVSRKNLKAGDLIFFDTSKRHRGYVNHVGIYLGNNKFIHASSAKRKVVITSLEKPFYKSRFKWGSRVKG